MKHLFIALSLFFALFIISAKPVSAACGNFFVDEGMGEVSNALTLQLFDCDEPFSAYTAQVFNSSGESITVTFSQLTPSQATATIPPGTFASNGTYTAQLRENGNLIDDDFFSLTGGVPAGGGGGGGGGNFDTAEDVRQLCPQNHISTAIGCIPFNNTDNTAAFFLRWAIGVAGGIAMLMIGFATYKISTSHGDPRRLQGGQELLLSSIGGLLMIMLSVYLLRFVGIDLLGIFT